MSQRPYQGGGQRPGQEVGWVPKTKLGKLVQAGEIFSMEEIFTQGMRIKEPEIVDTLLPNIQQEVLGIGFVQKQTDAGERSRFRAIVAVGNGDGYIGVGEGTAGSYCYRQGDDTGEAERRSRAPWMWKLGMPLRQSAYCTIQRCRKMRKRKSPCPSKP